MVLLITHSMALQKALETYIKKNYPTIEIDTVHNDIDGTKKIASDNTYKLILSDWDLDFVNGYELLVNVRNSQKYKDLPFVIITDKRDKESILSCIKASVTAYVMQPIDTEVIDQKIAPLLVKVAPKGTDTQQKQAAAKPIDIPPCPAIIIELYKELKKPTPSFATIIGNIKKDIYVTATLIKLANSPIYGMGKVDTVERALQVLGLKNFNNMILASALHKSIKDSGAATDGFWKHSVATATTCSYIAGKKSPGHVDAAYLVGLFHDCAIPLFLKRHASYEEIVNLSLAGFIEAAAYENKQYQTNHAEMSAFIVKTWGMPHMIYEAIRHHHCRDFKPQVDSSSNPEAKKLWAILVLAEHICHYYGYSSVVPLMPDADFAKVFEKALIELNMDVIDLKDMKEDADTVLKTISDSF
ncbi:MAG: HDOD domain-containing protein [Nitrospirae bacterium]|nr:HDOD domain-containing protein [Nitrospirota bacterium]